MRLNLATFVTGSTEQPDLSEDAVVDVLRDGGAALSAAQAENVEALLASTTSSKIRNAAALALLDASHPGLERALNQVLRRPAMAPYAGTLLFCLMEADLRLEAGAIANIVRNGSYESRSELLMLTSRGMVSFENNGQRDALHAELAVIAGSGQGEAAEVAELAIEDLEGMRPS